MDKLQKLMNDTRRWSDATFGEGDRNLAIIYHLTKEVAELIDAMEDYKESSNSSNMDFKEYSTKIDKVECELADCFLLLLDSAKHFGMDADDLINVSRAKLNTNKKRKWGIPDENGVVEHIKEDGE